MNLHYGDARNKNNSSGQNKLNKFTSNTYASSSINSPSSFPTLTSSLISNTFTYIAYADRCIDCDVPVFYKNLPVPEHMAHAIGHNFQRKAKNCHMIIFKIYNGTSALLSNSVRTSYVLFSVVMHGKWRNGRSALRSNTVLLVTQMRKIGKCSFLSLRISKTKE